MKVKAAKGLLCPMENTPREYIPDGDKGIDVPDTAYYRRLLTDGSLLEIFATPSKTKGGDQ